MSGEIDDIAEIRAWHAEWDNAALRHKTMPAGEAYLWESIDLLLAEVDRRDAIIRRLVESASWCEEFEAGLGCHHCRVVFDDVEQATRPEAHLAPCPWRQARELLGEQTEGSR